MLPTVRHATDPPCNRFEPKVSLSHAVAVGFEEPNTGFMLPSWRIALVAQAYTLVSEVA
jgi:hypothetical protein